MLEGTSVSMLLLNECARASLNALLARYVGCTMKHSFMAWEAVNFAYTWRSTAVTRFSVLATKNAVAFRR